MYIDILQKNIESSMLIRWLEGNVMYNSGLHRHLIM